MSKQSEQGFTLVEMLTVLSLIGLISGLMLAMIGQFRGLIAIDRSLTEQMILQKTVNHIAELISHAEALPVDTSNERVVQFMIGTINSIRILAVSTHRDSNLGLSEYSVLVDSDTNRSDLVEIQKPRRVGGSIDALAKTVLVQDIHNLSFAFLDTEAINTNRPNWQDNWSMAAKLPAVVKIVITKLDKSGKPKQASAIAYLAR